MSEDTKLTEQDMVSLQEQFPKLSKDIIMNVAVECQFNTQTTLYNLFEISKGDVGGARKKNLRSVDADEVRIVNGIREGWKVLILMRGLPGSGKTILANNILRASNTDITASKCIFSTDDYFQRNGRYNYDVKHLEKAHTWNQERCFKAMAKGVSPVIIDNTNLVQWEMEAYCAMAVQFAYVIEILEPRTLWARDPQVLAIKNTHNVSKDKIIRMLNKYEVGFTRNQLLSTFNLKYKCPMPQKRLFPPLIFETYPSLDDFQNSPSGGLLPGNNLGRSDSFDFSFEKTTVPKTIPIMEYVHNFDDTNTKETNKKEESKEEDIKINKDPEQAKVVSIETKVVPNEPMLNLIDLSDDNSATTATNSLAFPLMPVQAPKSDTDMGDVQFKKMKSSDSNSKLPNSVTSNSHLTAWGTDERALQSWETVVPLKSNKSEIAMDFEIFKKIDEASNCPKIQMSDKMTNTLSDDFKFAQNCPKANGTSILQTQSRQINDGGVIVKKLVPRKKITVDMGCMTENVDEVEKDEVNDHRRQLLDVFPNIPIEYMLDVYEKCQKDLYWTMELLSETDFVPNLSVAQNKSSMTEQCAESAEEAVMLNSWETLEVNQAVTTEKRKLPQDTMDLIKRQLEENVKFGKEHYSEHVWELKNQRQGTSRLVQENSFEDEEARNINYDSDSSNEESDDAMQVSLGHELVEQLEKIFGNEDYINKKFHTSIQLPASIARQLHALYLQSVCHQIEEQNELINKDEEYAQKLDNEEREMLKGPDLSAIMDEQLAQFYQKRDMEQYKTMSPDTLAIILKKNKLYQAFPSVAPKLIDNLLQTSNYNYEHVVDTLIASVNQNFITSDGNLRETPITDEIITDMKVNKALIEQVQKDDENRDAQEFRDEAMFYSHKLQHLQNLAQSYHKKGWGEVAVFYSKLAEDMKNKRDVANQKATHLHLYQNTLKLKGSNTLDLHFLTVKEAITSLDVFIDTHVSKLNKKRAEEFFIITGRGKRSPSGRSKLKPAVIARLKKRNVRYFEMNPGLLKIKLHKDLTMSTDLKNN